MATSLGAKTAEFLAPARAWESAEEAALRLELAGWPGQFPLLALPWELGKAAVLEVLDLRAQAAARAGDYPAWSQAAAWAIRVAAAGVLEFDRWRSVALEGRAVVVARGSL